MLLSTVSRAGQNPAPQPWAPTSQILLSTWEELKAPKQGCELCHQCHTAALCLMQAAAKEGSARGAAGGKVLLRAGQASLVLASFGPLHPAGTQLTT